MIRELLGLGDWSEMGRPQNSSRECNIGGAPQHRGALGSAREGADRGVLGVLSHHLKCEMKSPHLVDFS